MGKIANLVKKPNDYFMLPPGGYLGFGPVRRLAYRLSGGKRFGTGNSSLVAFSSAATPNLCDRFMALYDDPSLRDEKYMRVDDVFLSWFAQSTLAAIPTSLGVMFRREFLSRSLIFLWLKSRLPWLRRRRHNLVAVTLNGVDYKPEVLLKLPAGSIIHDSKGRRGTWSDDNFGPARKNILEYCLKIERNRPKSDPPAHSTERA
ncbi:MAG: hypothetical protein U1D06_02715 [Paracoccaceae bacterium]|nr:hypothetical protein [Paracoccaceae bacterium]